MTVITAVVRNLTFPLLFQEGMSAETEHSNVDAEWMPSGIAFGSGGVRTMCQLGVYTALYEAGLTARVMNWYGCSGGAVNAFFAALGVSASWVRDCIGLLDLHLAGKVTEELVLDYMNTWGVNSGETLIAFLGRIANTWEPGASVWTFADLARERPGTCLHIIATNISRGQLVTFNVTNTPDVRVLDAVRASSAIPLFFTPWISASGEYFCDGALLESYPWSCVADKDHTLVILNSDTEIRQFRDDHVRAAPTGLGEYMVQIFNTVRRGYMTSSTPPRHWIAVNNRVVSLVDFGITREQREALFAEGEVAGRAWIAFKRSRSATRQSRLGIAEQQDMVATRQSHSEAKTKSPHACDLPNTSASGRPLPDGTSDSHQSGSLLLHSSASRDSHIPRSRDRRWSL
jgi:predicted acylesterase/phospholipase RssA